MARHTSSSARTRTLRPTSAAATTVPTSLVKPAFVPRGHPPRTRDEVARHLLGVIAWRGIQMDDKDLAVSALRAWEAGHADDFVDCYLQARAHAAGERVCTVNLRHFDEAAHPADLVGMPRPGGGRRPPSSSR